MLEAARSKTLHQKPHFFVQIMHEKTQTQPSEVNFFFKIVRDGHIRTPLTGESALREGWAKRIGL